MLTISDATATSRFSDIVLRSSNRNFIVQLQGGVLGDGEIKTITMRGRGLLDVWTNLKAVCIKQSDLSNGVPLQDMRLERQAAVLGNGQLVNLAMALSDEVDRNEDGILVINPTFGEPALSQQAQLIFYPCDYLHVNAGTLSAEWLPSIPEVS